MNQAELSSGSVTLKAPLSGYLMPIEKVPDPVFSQKMVGDGVSIDPLDQGLIAPCDGRVLQIHPANHAVTIVSPEGLQVLIHIGLDSVNLRGKGFVPKVKTNDQIKAGDELITFDADFIATHAKSLLTMVVVEGSDWSIEYQATTGSVIAGQDIIMKLTRVAGKKEEVAPGRPVSSEAILIPNPTGLHARPAAVLANLAKKFKAEIFLHRDQDRANAKSMVAIMGLEIEQGDKVVLSAVGPDASEAIDLLTLQLRQGLGDEGGIPAPAPASVVRPELAAPTAKRPSADPNLLMGVAASPGLAVGQVFQLRRVEAVVVEDAQDPYRERCALDEAVNQANIQLEALQARLQAQADPGKAAIFAAHQELLADPALHDIAVSAMEKGKSAAFAWRQAYQTHARQLAALKNELMAGRANDLLDVGVRVLNIILGVETEEPEIPGQSIIIAENLTPSETAGLDRSKVVGFATTVGGATSHVAILARSLDIPAVAGVDPRALDLPDGRLVILDGFKGTLQIDPSSEETSRVNEQRHKLIEQRRLDQTVSHQPAVTQDGHRIEIAANIGGLEDATQVIRFGGEAVGLLRSEFLFMERDEAPGEEEQFESYRDITLVLGPDRPLVIRTLDVGGDKPLRYLPLPKEDNPFLGERGLRIGLDRPEILRTQLRAILRASPYGKLLVMFPMVATLNEFRAARAALEEERLKLNIEPIPVGIMVEIPAAAVMAEQFAKEADFFSIGTNDLTQYALAMDRGHPKLAPQVDGLNPAVLRLIGETTAAAHKYGRWVGVCGGLASEPQAVPFLIGLGVDELSVSIPSIPSIKALVRRLSREECRHLAEKARQMDTATEVRTLGSTLLERL